MLPRCNAPLPSQNDKVYRLLHELKRTNKAYFPLIWEKQMSSWPERVQELMARAHR